jgi:hypothetical protein
MLWNVMLCYVIRRDRFVKGDGQGNVVMDKTTED